MSSSPPVDRAVLAVCGFSGSGKTTLLEAAVRDLVARGLTIGVVKHDVHGLAIDRDGKDSDRLFRAGADVRLGGPGELVARSRPEVWHDVRATIDELLRDHDLVLVEGHKDTPLPKVWLAHPDSEIPPGGVDRVLSVLPWDVDRLDPFLRLATDRLERAWSDRLVYAGILVGGASRRMGRPKHLLRFRGHKVLEAVISALEPWSAGSVLLGSGESDDATEGALRLSDVPDTSGPMAGILAAMRWAPHATWVVAACDLPLIHGNAVRWLLDQRRPGRWGVVPRISQAGVEPLLAVYEPQARTLFEYLVRVGRKAPRWVTEDPRVVTPSPPADFASAWTNVNTPEDLASLG